MAGQSAPDSQQLLTTLVQSTAELAQSNKQQNHKIDTLIDQVGKLSEAVASLHIGLDEIKETTRQQAETAKIQAENVSQLIALLGSK